MSKLIEEYTAYISDSAFVYIERNRLLSNESRNNELFLLNEIKYSELLASVGLFTEAKIILDSIDESTLNKNVLIRYYLAQEAYYSYLFDYNQNDFFIVSLKKNTYPYHQKIFDLLKSDVPIYYLYQYILNIINKDYDKGIESMMVYQTMIPQNSRSYAISYHLLSEAYLMKNNIEKQQEYLTLSAIEDIKSVTKENRAIFELANLLFSSGDIPRAYKYIQSAMADANYYNARFRNVQIIKVLPIIEKAYQEEITEQNRRIKLFSLLIICCCILLFVIVFIVYRQRNKLKKNKTVLIQLNEDLETMAKNQQELIEFQKQLCKDLELKNQQISDQTRKLEATNLVKDEYVKQFLQMCGSYIDKLNEYQTIVNRKIKAGQINDLLKMSSSNKLILNEKKELLQKFDQAFLHIYPNFISQVNDLLKEDSKFALSNESILDNDLRILALTRLGIKNSSQIATFLGFTSQTMYTYRTKLRDKAIDRDNFEEKIMNITSILI